MAVNRNVRMKQVVRVIIPAYNEENAVAKVINEIPLSHVDEVVVVNNNSNDNTEINAKSAGATVLREERQGYGVACLKGIEYVRNLEESTDVIVFIDADYSDYPEELILLLDQVNNGNDLVIGSRSLGLKEKGSMTSQQIFGNWLATGLINLFYGKKFSDLGPFRAVTWKCLEEIKMQDTTYGWTVEMQLKVAKGDYSFTEVPVNYRVRVGKSKISGTLKGTVLAGYKIIRTIFKYL